MNILYQVYEGIFFLGNIFYSSQPPNRKKHSFLFPIESCHTSLDFLNCPGDNSKIDESCFRNHNVAFDSDSSNILVLFDLIPV